MIPLHWTRPLRNASGPLRNAGIRGAGHCATPRIRDVSTCRKSHAKPRRSNGAPTTMACRTEESLTCGRRRSAARADEIGALYRGDQRRVSGPVVIPQRGPSSGTERVALSALRVSHGLMLRADPGPAPAFPSPESCGFLSHVVGLPLAAPPSCMRSERVPLRTSRNRAMGT